MEVKYNMKANKIYCGDALKIMQAFPDESIDMCLCSPPYWGLRDYGTGKDQLGLEPTPELYIEHLTEIFNGVKRVLKKKGTLWLNIGDTYWSAKGSCFNPGGGNKSWKSWNERKNIYSLNRGNKSDVPNLPAKSLTMIPERLAWSLIQDGWILRNKIIWHKPNSMPSSVKDRFSNTWEYLFMFSKSNKPVYWTNTKTLKLVIKKPKGTNGIEGRDWEWQDIDGEFKKNSLWQSHNYYFDLDAVREAHKEPNRPNLDGGSATQSGIPRVKVEPRPKKKFTKHDLAVGRLENFSYPDPLHTKEYHPGGKNPGDVIETPSETRQLGAILGAGKAVKVPGGKGWTGHPEGGGAACQKDPRWCPPEGKNPGDFFDVCTQPFPEAHFAVFPEGLCIKPIKAGCPEDGIVLDPFCGAGTTCLVAQKLRRRYVGIDIKEEYCKIAEERLAQGVL